MTAVGTAGTFTTTTMDAGGYDLQLASGTYKVTFSGTGIAASTKDVSIGSQNIKLDLIDPATGTSTPPPVVVTPPPATNTVAGDASNNILRGTAGVDTIQGLGGNDTLYGLAGIDRLEGGTGNDSLFGHAGNDTLFGGSGYDNFVFNTAPNSTTNVDTIIDFSTVYDTIRLDNDVFTALTRTGTLSSAAFHTGAAAHDSSDRIIYDKATGALSYDPDGTGTAAATTFADIDAGLRLTNSDFIIF